jgi:16S rRNA (uracil1498-N3)-methyltransferase
VITLLVDPERFEGPELRVEGEPYRHLFRARRVAAGERLRVVDGRGRARWGEVAAVDRTVGTVRLGDPAPPNEPDLRLDLLVAVFRPERASWLVEKATELGAASLEPVVTQRSIVDRVNLARLASIAIEATEQCGRITVPAVAPAQPLTERLADWPAGRLLYHADETGCGQPIAGALSTHGPGDLLVGPAGGFEASELTALQACDQVVAISLGPRILRSETAALAALACWQAICGTLLQEEVEDQPAKAL